MSREKLIAYLWPEADAESGRRFLSDSVYRINQALGGDVIIAAGDDLRLDAQRLPSDVAEFDDALSKRDFERAVTLYSGPFLDGFFLSGAPEFERWVDGERDRRARDHARALEVVADCAEQAGERTVAVSWWRKLAALDPFNSRVALRLMRALDAAGERAAAIQHARIHGSLLESEMGLPADSEVTAYAETLRVSGMPSVRPEPAPIPRNATPTPRVAGSNGEQSKPVRATRHGSWRRGSWLATPLAATLAMIFLWIAGYNAARGNEPGIRSIAVLPFANLGPSRDDDYISDGIAEELISTLATIEGMAVASRTSSSAFKNRQVDVRDVGRALGVGGVVEGSVRRSGQTLRITARFVNATTGRSIWSDTYERPVADVLAIQEDLARAIVSNLSGTLLGDREVRLAEQSTHDALAYDLYLKGRFALHQRTEEGLRHAVEYFEQAVARAPTYLRAYVGLADAYAVSAFYDYRAPRDAYPKAEAAARNAMMIDPTLAAPHATLGYIHTYYDLDWSRAEEEFKLAIKLDSSYFTARLWYANLLTAAGRFAEAQREMRLAQEGDPLSPVANVALGWSLYYAGQYEPALEQARKTLALDSDFGLARLWGGWALEAMGRPEEACAWLSEAVRLTRGSVLTRLALAHAQAQSGSSGARDSAWAVVREMERRRASGEYIPSYEVGKLYVALNERARALDWFHRAYDERSHSRAFVRVDPQVAPMRADPGFTHLIESVIGTQAGGTIAGWRFQALALGDLMHRAHLFR